MIYIDLTYDNHRNSGSTYTCIKSCRFVSSTVGACLARYDGVYSLRLCLDPRGLQQSVTQSGLLNLVSDIGQHLCAAIVRNRTASQTRLGGCWFSGLCSPRLRSCIGGRRLSMIFLRARLNARENENSSSYVYPPLIQSLLYLTSIEASTA